MKLKRLMRNYKIYVITGLVVGFLSSIGLAEKNYFVYHLVNQIIRALIHR